MPPLSGSALRLLRDSVCWGRPRSLGRSFAYAALVLLASFAIDHSAFFVDGSVLTDGHALASLELAMVRAYCGPPSSFSTTVRIPYDVRDQISLRHVPLRELVIRKAGSVDAFCRSVNAPFVNNENSLMLLETAILGVAPGISVASLGQVLHLSRIAGVTCFVLLLFALGGSMALCLGTILCSLGVLNKMFNDIYSAYPFLFVMVLLASTFYGFALMYRWTSRPVGLVLTGAAGGALSAFIANMRTSYLPIVVLYFGCFLVSEWRAGHGSMNWRGRGGRVLALAGCFAVGFAGLQYGMITRSMSEDARHNAAHPIGHPLVLALSVPQNDFARQQGITWLDEVGRQKALGVDPTAIYLGPRYDGALLRYYRSLWRAHPREMLAVYYLKFSLSGTDMLAVLRGSPKLSGRAVRVLLTPLSFMPSGIWLLGLYATITCSSFAVFIRGGGPDAFILALLSLAACLAQIESGLIYSLFVQQYHNYLAFYAMFVSLVGFQALANVGWWMAVTSTFR